jgi:hypothetical protein
MLSCHVSCSAGRAATPVSFGLGPDGAARGGGGKQAHGRGPWGLGRVYRESRKPRTRSHRPEAVRARAFRETREPGNGKVPGTHNITAHRKYETPPLSALFTPWGQSSCCRHGKYDTFSPTSRPGYKSNRTVTKTSCAAPIDRSATKGTDTATGLRKAKGTAYPVAQASRSVARFRNTASRLKRTARMPEAPWTLEGRRRNRK